MISVPPKYKCVRWCVTSGDIVDTPMLQIGVGMAYFKLKDENHVTLPHNENKMF